MSDVPVSMLTASREQLLDLVHGSGEEAFDRSIDTRVSRLCRKLSDE